MSPILSAKVLVRAPTYAVKEFPPTRFFAVRLPRGTCSASVKRVDGKRDLQLGPTGRLVRTC